MISELNGHYNSVNCCTFVPSHQELYSGGDDRNILVWDPNEETTNRAYNEHVTEKNGGSNPAQARSLANTVTVDAWSDDSDDSD